MGNCNLYTFDTFESLSQLYNPGSRLQIRSSCYNTPPPPPPPPLHQVLLKECGVILNVKCASIQHCIVDGGEMGEFARHFVTVSDHFFPGL